jgi:hypothetical protein
MLSFELRRPDDVWAIGDVYPNPQHQHGRTRSARRLARTREATESAHADWALDDHEPIMMASDLANSLRRNCEVNPMPLEAQLDVDRRIFSE